MAWMDRDWPERDREYREKLRAEGRPLPPDTAANRTATRLGLLAGGITFAVLSIALALYLVAR